METKYNIGDIFLRGFAYPTEWEVINVKLINDISYVDQYNELGIVVTDKESVDMVQGDNIHPMILEAFTDPSTGVFNVDNVIGYLQNLSNQPVNQQQAWFSFESNLKPMRLRTKYDNLLSLTTNVNSLQSKSEYFNSSNTRDLSYYFVPYYMVPDSLFTVSKSEMNNYLRKNSEDYKQEDSRALNFVYFPLESSGEDSAFYISEIDKITNSLKSGEINDSTFALLNSDGFNPYVRFNVDQLPTELDNKEIGYVSDIVYEDALWEKWSELSVRAALDSGQGVFIDFTASWCLICQSNKALVIRKEKTYSLFEKYGIRLFLADWTQNDPEITRALESYGRSGVPLYILKTPDGAEQILPQNLNYSLLETALEELFSVE